MKTLTLEMKKESARLTAIAQLLEKIKPGDTLMTTVRHVSESGMYRVIDVYKIADNELLRYSWSIAEAIGYRYDKRHEGVGISGCGMDMCFAIVYNLGHALFPNGFDCIGDKCPSNDHTNRENNKHHKDGGYSLINRSF